MINAQEDTIVRLIIENIVLRDEVAALKRSREGLRAERDKAIREAEYHRQREYEESLDAYSARSELSRMRGLLSDSSDRNVVRWRR